MNDMQILAELRQLTDSMPRLSAGAKSAASTYRAAFESLKPHRERSKLAKTALKAVRARIDELMRSGEA